MTHLTSTCLAIVTLAMVSSCGTDNGCNVATCSGECTPAGLCLLNSDGGSGAGGGEGGRSPSCNASNCGGCCDAAGACVGGSLVAACGKLGNACIVCGLSTACQSGICTPVSGAGGGFAGAGGGFAGTGGGFAGTGGGFAGTGGGGGGAGSGGITNSAPTISSVAVNPSALSENGTSTLSIVVADADGVMDIQGGRLTDALTGTLYDTFNGPVGTGTLVQITATIRWSDLNAARSINFPAGGGTRDLNVSFTDRSNHTVTQKVPVALRCASAGLAACNGACRDLSSDPMNCGSCGRVVPSGAYCQQGTIDCGSNTLCGGNTCVWTVVNVDNCGACGNKCSTWASNHGISLATSGTRLDCSNSKCTAYVRPTTTTTCTALCASKGTTCTEVSWGTVGSCGNSSMSFPTTCGSTFTNGLTCDPNNYTYPLCNCQ